MRKECLGKVTEYKLSVLRRLAMAEENLKGGLKAPRRNRVEYNFSLFTLICANVSPSPHLETLPFPMPSGAVVGGRWQLVGMRRQSSARAIAAAVRPSAADRQRAGRPNGLPTAG